MFGGDPDGVEQQITDWQSMLEARSRRAADVAIQLRGQRFEGEAANGMVIATVDQAGHLVDLRLHRRVRDWPTDWIARAVLEASAAARQTMTMRVRELLSEAGFTDAAA